MLILSRKADESIRIGHNITITITILDTGTSVRVGIKAPSNIEVHREEVYQRILESPPEQSPTCESDAKSAAR